MIDEELRETKETEFFKFTMLYAEEDVFLLYPD